MAVVRAAGLHDLGESGRHSSDSTFPGRYKALVGEGVVAAETEPEPGSERQRTGLHERHDLRGRFLLRHLLPHSDQRQLGPRPEWQLSRPPGSRRCSLPRRSMDPSTVAVPVRAQHRDRLDAARPERAAQRRSARQQCCAAPDGLPDESTRSARHRSRCPLRRHRRRVFSGGSFTDPGKPDTPDGSQSTGATGRSIRAGASARSATPSAVQLERSLTATSSRRQGASLLV